MTTIHPVGTLFVQIPWIIKDGVLRCRLCNYKLAQSGDRTASDLMNKTDKHYQTEHRAKHSMRVTTKAQQ